jgi:type VI secretion system protein ImpA
MFSVTQRVAIDLTKLKMPLSADEDMAGVFLQYDPIYDQIKEARREDDETLSQGIWQTELKRADWFLVESLCIHALETKTKDLQILGWLCEAWTVLDHMQGLQKGLQLINSILHTLWDKLHPIPEAGEYEYRLRIFDWFHEAITSRLIFMPIAQGSDFSINLADWAAAINLDVIAKRSSDGKNILAKAEASDKITLSKFRKNLKRALPSSLENMLKETENAQEALDRLVFCLKDKIGTMAPVFSRIKTSLDDIIRICKTGLELQENDAVLREKTTEKQLEKESIETLLNSDKKTRQEKSLPTADDDENTLTVSGRKEAYQALEGIGAFLKSLDPHSPAPYLIDLIVQWQDKSLVDILSDLPKEKDGAHQLLRVLGNAANQPLPAIVNVMQQASPQSVSTLPQSMFGGAVGG